MSNFIYSDKIIVSTPLVHDENGYYHLIYCITNTINGKIYIGKHSTKNPYDDYMGSGKLIIQALRKYGVENFTKDILYCFTNETEAFLKEEKLVTQEFIDREDTYNIITGGIGPSSEDIRGERNPFYNKHHTQDTKNKMSKARAGKHHTQDTKNKISKSLKGRPSPMRGKHLSEETREKQSKSLKGQIRSQKTRDKISNSKKREKNPKAKAVLKIDEFGNIVTEYGCIKDCREQEHIDRNKMNKILKEHILYNGFYFVIKPKN